MTSAPDRHPGELAAAAAAGDDGAFAELTALHRRELHVHCYRMLACYEDADDALQETFLRAWRSKAGLADSRYRAWLYRIATNVCLDMIRARSRQTGALQSFADVPWLQPYPDRQLDELAPSADQPDQVVVERETIELALLAALQCLPPRQRAALIIRDVMGWPAAETAELLQTSVAAANSALQRARVVMREQLSPHRADWQADQPTTPERKLLDQFMAAHERLDAEAVARIAAADIRVTMPPYPYRFQGRDSMLDLLDRARQEGDWRLAPTAANRMPAAASYLRQPGDSQFRAFKLDVLRIEDGAIAEITTFGPGLLDAFGLPPILQ